MKNIFKIGLFATVASTLFASCLKDTPVTDYSESAIKPVVLIPNGNYPSTNQAAIIAFEAADTPSTLNITVRVSWSKPLGKPLTVTIAKNSALITSHNTQFGTNYQELSATAWSLSSYSVTIDADKNEATFPLKIATSKVDLSKENMLAFTITDASGETISSNFKNILLPIGVKNRFDGVWDLTKKQVGWAAYGIADNQTFHWGEYELITAGVNSVTTFNGFSNLLAAFTSSGGLTQFGATAPRFTFDATNKLVAVQNDIPDDGRGRVLVMNPAVTDSRFDPAAKKIYLSYIMKQNGRPNQFMYDTLVYISPR
ncbi:MAG: DUF1735 domain-containing protein [Chitinophagaceae bacterium]|uniref:DUF1735 domain-containing protein n=1 Tax=unclassified Paraflavitalea TaxID=2798305 RepID=UPI003D3298AA|nr:DUF1735 domain-containing protein [Chitinophagaceae bacterium]